MSICHLCAAGDLRELPQYTGLSRVTSDCKPWPAGGRLGVCVHCGTVQKFVDARWQAEIASIYSDYTIYFQAGGAEQAVFFADTAPPVTRSEWLVQQVIGHAPLPPAGRLLDVGCGNGAFLRAFSQAMPGWTLAGTELSDATRAIVEGIPGVAAFYTGPLQDIPGQFDMISLVHVLEHISHPVQLLATVAGKLRPDGIVFIQVPDSERNPFDLLIADHVSHFTGTTLKALVEAGGYAIAKTNPSWVVKEISALATYNGRSVNGRVHQPPGSAAGLEWLVAVRAAVRRARASAVGKPFGLFGSSIAATWLAHEVECAIDFFVDEDPSRQRQHFMGRTVLSPSEVPAGAVVFVGIGGGVADSVAQRLSQSSPAVSWIPAPPLV